jgi:hypothetical protein
LSATIVDSVLYHATNSTSLSYSSAISGFTKTKNSDGTVTYSWSGGYGPFTVSAGSNSGYGCTNSTINATSCTSASPVLTTVQATLTDAYGESAGPISSPKKVKTKP